MRRRLSQLIVAGLAVAALSAAASNATTTGWTVERYYAKETSHVFVDNGSKDGGGPGDIYVSQQALNAGGKQIGTVNGYGVNLHAPYVFFQYTAVIGASTLTVQGAVSLKAAAQAFAIVGGTGRYAGMSGTVTTTDAGSKGSLVVVRYRR